MPLECTNKVEVVGRLQTALPEIQPASLPARLTIFWYEVHFAMLFGKRVLS